MTDRLSVILSQWNVDYRIDVLSSWNESIFTKMSGYRDANGSDLRWNYAGCINGSVFIDSDSYLDLT